MAYNEQLATRIRRLLADRDGVSERKMFGGLAFMVHGNMCVGVNADELMVRVGPDAYDKAHRRKHVREMDFTGRALIGYVYVLADGVGTSATLMPCFDRCVAFAESLPSK